MHDFFHGLRIVECSAFVAAPLCGNTFGQYGADVVRIDPLQGGIDYSRWPLSKDGGSLYWAGLNNTKRSVRLDLSRPEGRELAVRLITAPGERAGVFCTNLRAAWLRYDQLAEQRSDLIMLTIFGHPDGRSAVDYTLNAETGVPAMTGEFGASDPVNHSLPAWDIATGLHAAFALSAALHRRDRTGQGCQIELSLADVAYSLLGQLGYSSQVQAGDGGRPAIGNYLYGAFGKDVLSRDGRRVMVVAITQRQWESLLRATGLAVEFAEAGVQANLDLRREGDRYLGRQALTQILATWAARHEFEEIARRFTASDVCWAPYRTMEEAVASDPRYSSVGDGVFEPVMHPGVGRFSTSSAPTRVPSERRGPAAAAPRLGRDTEAVLTDVLGWNAQQVDQLRIRGLI